MYSYRIKGTAAPEPEYSYSYTGTQNPPLTEAELKKYLEENSEFQVGTWVTYRGTDVGNATLANVSIILKIETDHTKVKKDYNAGPRCFLMFCPKNRAYITSEDWVRMSDANYNRVLTAGEYENLIAHDVQLQDYIQQVRDSGKAGIYTL